MALQEKYINPFTDFGLFAAAGLAKFNHEEMTQYEQSLKYYRDLKNVIDTSFGEGELKGDAARQIKVALEALREGLPLSLIAKLTELTEAELEILRETPSKP